MVISQVFCINPEAEMINDNPETGNRGVPDKVPGFFALILSSAADSITQPQGKRMTPRPEGGVYCMGK